MVSLPHLMSTVFRHECLEQNCVGFTLELDKPFLVILPSAYQGHDNRAERGGPPSTLKRWYLRGRHDAKRRSPGSAWRPNLPARTNNPSR
jgi:hypothetical protein